VGDNTKAMVVTRGLTEMTRLGVAMGADQRTFAGLTGLGDLMATCSSPLSRNRTVGVELARGRSIEEITTSMRMVAEGIKTASVVVELARQHGVEVPIAIEVNGVVTTDVEDDKDASGVIGIQHHGEKGQTYKFRNLRIKELD
jgi:glycerol-3-phosphate dehydrogenase (NAD(P)+)